MIKRLKELIPQPVKTILKLPRRMVMRATAQSRVLPDFVLLGAMKSGTTSLFHCLCQHPGIRPCFTKEVHFFDQHYARGEQWYRSHFPLQRSMSGGMLAGEATPMYLYHPDVPRRIHTLMPNVNLIALLRNPTERAVSHYYHSVKMGWEVLPIADALEAEDERIRVARASRNEDRKQYLRALIYYSYKSRGVYIDQLRRYRELFSEGQMLFLGSADFFAEPTNTLQNIFCFLGVSDNHMIRDLAPKNTGARRTDAPADVYEMLDRYFAPYNNELFDELHCDFGWNSPAGDADSV